MLPLPQTNKPSNPTMKVIIIDGNSVLKFVALLALLVLVFNLLRYRYGWGRDDSDGPRWFQRSDMRVLTDHKTGVEYLSTQNGGLCVRVDVFGKPSVPAKLVKLLEASK